MSWWLRGNRFSAMESWFMRAGGFPANLAAEASSPAVSSKSISRQKNTTSASPSLSIYIGRLGVGIFHQAAIFLWNTEEGDHHKERKGRKGEGAWQKDGVKKMRSHDRQLQSAGANKHFILRYMGFQNVRSLRQIVRSYLHGRRFNEEISADCTSNVTRNSHTVGRVFRAQRPLSLGV